MFKHKPKNIVKKIISITCCIAMAMSSIAYTPKEAKAFGGTTDERFVLLVDLGFTPSATNGGWSTNADYISSITKATGTTYYIGVPKSTLTTSGMGINWSGADAFLANSVSKSGYGDVVPNATKSPEILPVFYRNGYKFVGWDLYTNNGGKPGNFIGGYSKDVALPQYDYSNRGLVMGNIVASETSKSTSTFSYCLKAVWQSVSATTKPTKNLQYVHPITKEVITEYQKSLNPSCQVKFNGVATNFLAYQSSEEIGSTVVLKNDIAEDNTKIIKTGSIPASEIMTHSYSAMDYNGQWVNYTYDPSNKISVKMNPNGGTAKYCDGETNYSTTTTAYRMKDFGTKVRLYPATKSGYTFIGYSTDGGATTSISANNFSSGYYDVTPTSSVTYTAQYTQNMSVTGSDYVGVYDKNAHSITLSGVPAGATVSYKADGAGSYTSTNPSFKTGSHSVNWKVEKSGFTTVSGTNNVVISDKDLTNIVTSTGVNTTYDGTAKSITINNVPSDATVQYSTDNKNWSTVKPTFTDAPTNVTVYWKVSGSGYVTITGQSNVKISTAPMPGVTVNSYEGTYDGKSHNINITAPADSTVTYCLTEDGTYTSANPSFTNAGTTTVYYKIEKADYTPVKGSASVIIKQANFNISAQNVSYAWDGLNHSINTPIVTAPNANVSITYSMNSESGFEAQKPEFSASGIYKVYYKIVDTNGNYKSITGNNTITIEKSFNYDSMNKALTIYDTTDAILNHIYQTYPNTELIMLAENADGKKVNYDKFDSLKKIEIDGINTKCSSKNGMLYSTDGCKLIRCPENYEAENVTLPYSTTTILENAFKDCKNIDNVIVKNPSSELEDNSIQAPLSIIGFKGSTAIEYAKSKGIKGTLLTEIEDGFFRNETTMTKFNIPDNISSIGKNAFAGCTNLTKIGLGNVQTIGNSAFKNTNLESVIIPESTTNIGEDAFYYNTNLTEVEFEAISKVLVIGKDAFAGCNVEEITIPECVNVIGEGAFNNTPLKLIDFEGMNAEITWNEDDKAFPTSTVISCFYGSKPYEFAKAHGYAISLKVGFDEDGVSSYERDEDNIPLIHSVVFGPNLTDIGDDAFNGASELDSAVFVDKSKVETIGERAFANTKIVDITLPEATKTIGTSCFENCTSLENVDLGGVTDIPEKAFKNDTSLTTIQDTTKITSIGNEAFYNTTSLTGEFTTGDNLEGFGENAFGGTCGLSTLTVENPNATFPENKGLISDSAVIKGYPNSTADIYSQKYYKVACQSLGRLAYQITFDAVGGSDGTDSIYVVNGKKIPTIKAPRKEDYVFLGYYTSTDGGGTLYFNNDGTPTVDEFSGTSNMTLTANWGHEQYTIKYHDNTEEDNIKSDSVDTKTNFMLSKNEFERENYTFLGWNTDKDAKVAKYTDRETVLLNAGAGETVDLYAIWKATFYTVTFNANGTEGTMSPQLVSVNKRVKLRKNTFVREGYTFLGWSEDPDATEVTYYDGQPILHIKEAEDTLALYAVWAKGTLPKHDITFDGNGGNGSEIAPTYGNHPIYVPDINISREGFEFQGWTTIKGSDVVEYHPGDIIYTDKDISLYAVWATKGNTSYQLIVSTQKVDGTYDTKEKTMTADAGTIVTFLEGIDFIVNDGYHVNETNSVLSQTIASDTTFHIFLDRDKVGVNYILNGEGATMNKPAQISNIWGSKVILDTTMPERQGYTFVGWGLTSDATIEDKVTEVTLGLTGTDVYAIWKAEESAIIPTEAPTETIIPTETANPTISPDVEETTEPVVEPTEIPVASAEPTNVPEVEPTDNPDRINNVISTPIPSNTPEVEGPKIPTANDPIVINKTENNTTIIESTTPTQTPVPSSDGKVVIKKNTVTIGKVVYKKQGKKAVVTKVTSKKVKKVTIQNKVTINGKKYKVTKINKNVFKNCKKLKKITIKSKSLTSIGKNAFKNISKKAVIKLPKNKKLKKKYKKLLKKAKLSKKVKIK